MGGRVLLLRVKSRKYAERGVKRKDENVREAPKAGMRIPCRATTLTHYALRITSYVLPPSHLLVEFAAEADGYGGEGFHVLQGGAEVDYAGAEEELAPYDGV